MDSAEETDEAQKLVCNLLTVYRGTLDKQELTGKFWMAVVPVQTVRQPRYKSFT